LPRWKNKSPPIHPYSFSSMSSGIDQSGVLVPRWRILAEIALVFAVFFLQGAWPVPDVNEPYYLGKAIHYWNPSWAAGDFFLDSKDIHKVFYLTFGWLSLCLTPTALAWTGRLITWWLLAWSWRRLSFAVLPRPDWSILSAALFAMLMDNFHMAGEWVIGGVEAKGFAYVFVFLGLESLVRNRWNRAWLLLGAASALHVLVGGWAAIAAGLAWLLIGHDRPKLRTMWLALLGGFLLALPGLVPAILLNSNADAETIHQANQIYVFERLPHHLDIFHIYPQFIIRFVLLTSLYFTLSWRISLIAFKNATGGDFTISAKPTNTGDSTNAGRTAFRSFWMSICNLQFAIYNLQSNPKTFNDIKSSLMRFRAFVTGAIAIALAGAAINLLMFFDRDLAAGLLRYYWFRLSDVAVPLGVAMLGCWWIVDSWPAPRDCPNFRISENGTVPFARTTRVARFAAILAGLALIYHFGSLSIQRLQPTTPPADRLANPLDWQEACLWAADGRNTPPTARFITPRSAQTFKWYAGHAEVATWKDVPQNAAEIVKWWTRMQDLFAADGGDPEYPRIESLNELSPQRIEAIGRKYKADFLITEMADPPLNLKVVYRNESYIIYQLSPP
jgi:hypothetical protein